MGIEGFDFKNPKRFYVYVIFHPITAIPVYVGKGTERRDVRQASAPKGRRLKFLRARYGPLPVVRIRNDLTEPEAFDIEKALIRALGRTKSGGCLFNVTEGGDGVTGMRHTRESRERISRANKGRKWPKWFGERVSAALIGRPSKRGAPPPETLEKARLANLGAKRSQEARENMRRAHVGKLLSAEHRKAILDGKARAAEQRTRQQ